MPKSYLSRTLLHEAELNQDQMFSVCEYLKFDDEQSQYMFLLLEYARCGLHKRKKILKSQIKQVQAKNCRTEQYIEAMPQRVTSDQLLEYYLDPIHQIVHVSLSIERYAKNPKSLAAALGLANEKMTAILVELERMQLIEIQQNRVNLLQEEMHLPVDSPLYPAWKQQVSVMSSQRLRLDNDGYGFSVTFTADEKTRKDIQVRFLAFLEETEKSVKNAKEEKSFQVNFDLFSWC